MKVLLDSNVIVLWSNDRRSVRPEVDELLMSPGTDRLVSVVSPWELAIKWRTGKLELPDHPRRWIARAVQELVLVPLAISVAHAVQVADLPDHHRDPFDRLLIAQAQIEGIPIVTTDATFAQYDVEVIAAR